MEIEKTALIAIEAIVRQFAIRDVHSINFNSKYMDVSFQDGGTVRQDFTNPKFLYILYSIREFNLSSEIAASNDAIEAEVSFTEAGSITKLYQVLGVRQNDCIFVRSRAFCGRFKFT